MQLLKKSKKNANVENNMYFCKKIHIYNLKNS